MTKCWTCKLYLYLSNKIGRGYRGPDRMVVGFTTTFVICAYRHCTVVAISNHTRERGTQYKINLSVTCYIWEWLLFWCYLVYRISYPICWVNKIIRQNWAKLFCRYHWYKKTKRGFGNSTNTVGSGRGFIFIQYLLSNEIWTG